MIDPDYISVCHNAPVEFDDEMIYDDEGIFYVCTKCKKLCQVKLFFPEGTLGHELEKLEQECLKLKAALKESLASSWLGKILKKFNIL